MPESLAQVFSYDFCEISKNTFFHRTPLVAASETFKKDCSATTVNEQVDLQNANTLYLEHGI